MARLTAAVIGCALVVLAGCQEPEPTRPEFVNQLDSICARANESVTAVAAPDAADRAAVADAIDEIVEIQRAELESIHDLVPPRDDRDLVRQWLENVRTALDDSAAAADALRAGDLATARSAADEASRSAVSADEQARALGATTCAVATDSTVESAPTDG